ncbi:BtpA/SgcQ family protein [Salinibacillus xinjiangensis]|uniref:BtpA/SgcQ family protein n=1 Tax=Salinibacillus xinjiangensis TaxID=1229268 RepID=A0A6G1XB40_9BACI|nr:BtpA/SgcQ family protein [Salinibacillus xinjiangensis]MRG88139.1 BtpA/SgcQ family protein [Salinibacillus xinjiangensis]
MSEGIFIPKPNYIKEIFDTERAIIGMVHLKPLPGAPYYNGESLKKVYDFAMSDVHALENAGVDGIIIENAWDIPFSKPEDIGFETVAAMSTITEKIKQQTHLKIGINCLANGALQALAVAKATEVSFVRVNQWVNAYVANEGFVEGASAKAMRYRSQIKGESIKVFADVHVKHGSHSIIADRGLADQTHDNIFFDADVLIATGSRTGNETEVGELKGIKENSNLPVIVGSGMTVDNAEKILSIADGCIIGSSLKVDGKWWNPVDEMRVREFIGKVRDTPIKGENQMG